MVVEKIEHIGMDIYKIIVENKQGLIKSKKNLKKFLSTNQKEKITDYSLERSSLKTSFGQEIPINILIEPIYDLVSDIVLDYYLLRSGTKVYLYNLTRKNKTKLPDVVTEVYLEYNDTLTCLVNGKWGAYSLIGLELIPPLYDEIIWKSPYYHLYLDGKIGLYNYETGLLIAPEYSKIQNRDNNLVYVSNSKKRGVLFFSGEMIPAKTYHIQSINKDSSWIDIDGKKGLISADGRIIVYPSFDSYHSINSQELFVIKSNNKYGLLSITSGILVEPKYSSYKSVDSEELIYVKENNKWGLIDFSGKIILSPRYDLKSFPKIEYLFTDETSGRIYINLDNNKIFSEKEEVGRKLDFSWYVLNRNNQSVLFDEKGNVCGVFPQQDLQALRKDYFLFHANNRVGLVSLDGTVIIKPQFDEIKADSDNIFRVRVENKWGVISAEGCTVLDMTYDEIIPFSKGTTKFRKESKWGIAKNDGRIILDPLYDSIEKGNDKAFFVQSRNKWGLLSTETWELLPLRYDLIKSIPGYMFAYFRNGKWGAFDINENEVLPEEYDDITFYMGNKFKVILDGRSGTVKPGDLLFEPDVQITKKPITGDTSRRSTKDPLPKNQEGGYTTYDFSDN